MKNKMIWLFFFLLYREMDYTTTSVAGKVIFQTKMKNYLPFATIFWGKCRKNRNDSFKYRTYDMYV